MEFVVCAIPFAMAILMIFQIAGMALSCIRAHLAAYEIGSAYAKEIASYADESVLYRPDSILGYSGALAKWGKLGSLISITTDLPHSKSSIFSQPGSSFDKSCMKLLQGEPKQITPGNFESEKDACYLFLEKRKEEFTEAADNYGSVNIPDPHKNTAKTEIVVKFPNILQKLLGGPPEFQFKAVTIFLVDPDLPPWPIPISDRFLGLNTWWRQEM